MNESKLPLFDNCVTFVVFVEVLILNPLATPNGVKWGIQVWNESTVAH